MTEVQPDARVPDQVYPILLTGLQAKLAVVVGGGLVGERKVAGLLAAAANVRLISPTATPALTAWAQAEQLAWWSRPYQAGDLVGAFLVFVATNIRTVNAQVAQEAAHLGILCNVADAPAEGNFHVPALYRHEDVVVAIGSRQVKNPKRIKHLRDQIAHFLRTFHAQP